MCTGYATALKYLDKSLAIRREIGDTAGLVATLHNMANIALENEETENALAYWEQALQLAVQTGNAEGVFHVGGALGRLLAGAGQTGAAVPLLSMAIEAGKRAGFTGVDELVQMLQSVRGKKT